MAKTKISQFDATAANNTDLNSISIAEGTAPSNINNAIRELMSQLADLNLGNEVLSTLKIDNLHLDGNTIVTLDTNGDLNLTPNGTGAVTIAKVDINGGAIDGTPIGAASANTGAFTTLSASSTANLGSSVTVSGGNIDGVIGANTPAAITGTVITANTNFAGNLTGNVTGTVDGVVGGTTPAAVTGTTITANTKFVGAIDGNVTATSGTSTFNNVTINGTLDMDSTTSQTITGLATPSGSTDAATKGYVDTEVSGLVDSAPAALNTLNELAAALGDDASFSTTVTNSIAAKLPLAGGTMTGDINANSNTVSGLKAPSASNDATTKTYVDTADALKLNLSGGTLSGNIAMGDNKVTGLAAPTADGDAARKKYVDDIAGSGTAAATSASNAATSATNAANSATASANSATAASSSAASAAASYDSFDDRYLGAKSSAPSVDNDGDALVTGALYFNTTSNQLFVRNSSSAWVQAAFTASGFLSNLSEDTTPQLGGDLDINGQNIVSTSNADIDILPNGSGKINLDGNGSSGGVTVSDGLIDIRTGTGAVSKINFYCESSNAHAQTIQAQPHSAGVTNVLTLPAGGDQEIVGASATQTLTNKTIDASQLSGSVANARLDADLQALAGLTSAADKGIQFTGSGTAGTYDLTSAGKALLDDADAAAQRTTLGLGSAATLTAGTSASNAVQLDGSAKLPAVDGSALTNLPASGGVVSLVADGGITAGKPVILTAAGKAKQVGTTTISAGLGTENSTTLSDAEYHEEAYGKENEFINIYRIDTSDTNIYVTPNTISSSDLTTITKGTTASVDVSYLRAAGIIYEPNQDKYVIVTMNSSNYLTGIVATFNGTGSSATVTLGTPTVLDSSGTYQHGTSNQNLTYDTNEQKIIVAYCNASSSASAIVVTLSGTTLTAGSRISVDIYGSYINDGSVKVAYSSTEDRVVFLYADTNNNKYYTTTGEVSGNNISWGSTQEVTNQVTGYTNNGGNGCIAIADTGEVVLTYLNSSSELFSHAGTLSNTTITWGSPSQVSNIICYNGKQSGGDDQCGQAPIGNGKIIFARSTQSSSPSLADKGVYGVITVSGTSVTNGTPASFNDDATGGGGYYDYRYAGVTTNVSKTQAVFGSGLKTGKIDNIVLLESDGAGPSNLTSTNFLGLAAESISDTATGKITIQGGINENQTSLTIGTNYFATDSGTVATTGTQLIGRSIAADKIQIGVKTGTVAHNAVALDANAKLPAVDGSQLTNLPASTVLGSRIFCGSYDFRVDGSSTAQNVLISLPSGYTAANVRSYEINVHGVGFAADGNFLCMLPYNGSSSVYSGSTYNTYTYMNGNSGTATNNSKTQSTAFILNWSNGTSYDLYSANDVDNPKQNYDNAGGHGGQLVCRAVYTNSLRNGSLMYDASWRYATANNGHARVLSIASADGATTSNYADGFYFYVGNDSQVAQTIAIMEGVISVYAIIG